MKFTNQLIVQLLDEIVQNTSQIYGDKLKEIVLYGSYAKGQEDDESDIDIMVLVNIDEKELAQYDEKINQMIGDMSMKYFKVISLVDMSYEKFMKWVNIVPYYTSVSSEGVVLYAV
jgi:uncharacterized protein